MVAIVRKYKLPTWEKLNNLNEEDDTVFVKFSDFEKTL